MVLINDRLLIRKGRLSAMFLLSQRLKRGWPYGLVNSLTRQLANPSTRKERALP